MFPLCSVASWGRVMIRAVVEEAAALASITLFVGMIVVWAQVLAAMCGKPAEYPVPGGAGPAVALDKARPEFAGSGWSNRPFRARRLVSALSRAGSHGRIRASPPSFGLFTARRRAS